MSVLRCRQRLCFRLAQDNLAFRPPFSARVRFTSTSASSSLFDVAPEPKPRPPRKNHASQMPSVPNPASETRYTLSLNVSPTLYKAMNRLRQTYFPAHLNRLDAHITLFHALPLSHLHDDIIPLLIDLAVETPSYHIHADYAKSIGKGVIIPMYHRGPRPHTTIKLRRQMQRAWSHFLSKQDQQNPPLHWTVMNKVDDVGEVKRVEKEVNSWLVQQKKSKYSYDRHGAEGWATGLTLWRYDEGLWVDPKRFDFRGDDTIRKPKNANTPDSQTEEPVDNIAELFKRDKERRQRIREVELKRADKRADKRAAKLQAGDKGVEERLIDYRQQADEWLRRQKTLAADDDDISGPGNVVSDQQAETVADPKETVSKGS